MQPRPELTGSPLPGWAAARRQLRSAAANADAGSSLPRRGSELRPHGVREDVGRVDDLASTFNGFGQELRCLRKLGNVDGDHVRPEDGRAQFRFAMSDGNGRIGQHDDVGQVVVDGRIRDVSQRILLRDGRGEFVVRIGDAHDAFATLPAERNGPGQTVGPDDDRAARRKRFFPTKRFVNAMQRAAPQRVECLPSVLLANEQIAISRVLDRGLRFIGEVQQPIRQHTFDEQRANLQGREHFCRSLASCPRRVEDNGCSMRVHRTRR